MAYWAVRFCLKRQMRMFVVVQILGCVISSKSEGICGEYACLLFGFQ